MTRQATADATDRDREFREQLTAIIPSLRAFARGLCGNMALADDLAQEAMVRAWSARASYEMGTNFRAWMYTILRNQFYSTVRKNSRMVAWDPEVAERVMVAAPTQHHRLNVRDVIDALQKLPAEQREALMLVAADGLSYEETATVMNCAVGTIKSRVARGRVALAALIDGPEDAIDVLAQVDEPRKPRQALGFAGRSG